MDMSFIIATRDSSADLSKIIFQLKQIRQIKYEIIISDNHSTDATVSVARKDGVKVVTQPTDVITSITECNNNGAKAAIGEILWFIPPEAQIIDLEAFVDEVVDYFKQHATATALIPCIYTNQPPITFLNIFQQHWHNFVIWVKNRILKTGATQANCLIVRRSVFEKMNGFDPQQSNRPTTDLMHKLAKQGEIKMFWHRHIIVPFNLLRYE